MWSPQGSKTSYYQITLGTILLLSYTCSSSQPPYQVSLYVSLHPRAPPIHYCNGVIVHSRLVLTTASCVFYQSSVIEASSTPAVQIPAEKISVVAGVAGIYNVVNSFDVLEINIAKGFNITTMANNLAILHLDTSLPLGQHENVQWITLDDYEYEAEGLYMAGFPSLNVDPNFMLLENVQILPNEQCTHSNPLAPNIRKDDICTLYPNTLHAVGPDCELPLDFATFNADYGTGLIIRNHLIALFSQIIAIAPNQTDDNCHSQQSLKAVFTAVGPYLDWIYGAVANAEMLALKQQDTILSAPYRQRSSSAIKSVLSNEPAAELLTSLSLIGTTIATTRTTTTTTTTSTTTFAFAHEPIDNPSTTVVDSPQPLSVSGAHKAIDIKFATLNNGLLLLILAYFLS